MNAIDKLRSELAQSDGCLKPLRVLAASGQLDYGIPGAALASAALARRIEAT